MVFVADAIVEPRAMVVHLQNTPFAHTAMVRPQRLHGFAFLATIVILLKGYFVNVFRNNRSSPSDVQPERERERERERDPTTASQHNVRNPIPANKRHVATIERLND